MGRCGLLGSLASLADDSCQHERRETPLKERKTKGATAAETTTSTVYIA